MFGKLGHRLGVLLAICFLATCSGCQQGQGLLNRIFPNTDVAAADGPIRNLFGHPMAMLGTLIVVGLIAAVVATKFFKVNLSFAVPILTKFIAWVFTPALSTEQKLEQTNDKLAESNTLVATKLDQLLDQQRVLIDVLSKKP